MADYSQWLSELSKRSGASVEQSDLTALQGKNPEDVEAHKRALEAQYAKRGAPTSSRTQDSQSGAYPDVGGDPRASVQASSASLAPAASTQAQASSAPSAPAASTPAQSWNSAPAPVAPAPAAPAYPSWYDGLMAREAAQREAAQQDTKGRADALYSTLDARANQGLQVNASDPIIRGQVDAYGAQQERAKRNYLSDVAERSGPYANMRGEQRMAAERVGQNTSGFQAELMGRELGSRRDEIAQALAMQGGMLSGDQQRNLQAQLAAMDQALGEAGVGMAGRGLDLQSELGRGGLGLQRDLGMGGLDLQRMLGQGGLDLQRRGQDLSQDAFLKELALREWGMGEDNDFRWSGL